MIEIGHRKIGSGEPALIVAEISGNHLHKFDLAVKTIHAMKEAGADAVKLQTFTADTITLDANTKYFQIKDTIWAGQNMHKLFAEVSMPWDWQPKLKKVAEDLGMMLFSTPFDFSSVDFLAEMGVPCYKVASPEIVDLPLIEHIASKNKPVILATGVAALADIRAAVNACHNVGNHQIIILKCTSAYPTPWDEVNLQTMVDIKKKFKTVVGISDHTPGSVVPISAVALGASMIEKHFILDRHLGGPDSSFSLEPNEFKKMVDEIRQAEKALGHVNYQLTPGMKIERKQGRSLFVVADIKKGEIFTTDNVRSIRPGDGLPPKFIGEVLGKKAKSDIKKGNPLTWKQIIK
ncbi:MAG: pseudaminic acid synthase [Patescibacteria group bacterium]|jgi:pseudaminic acid synthase